MIDLLEDFKYWLEGLEIVKLVKAVKSFYAKAEVWIQVPLKQKDIENCHPSMLSIHGWGRRTDRFPGEDIDLYRSRVHNAFTNNQDAGFIRGLEDMLDRFGVPEYEIFERLPQVDPDVVTIQLPQGGITEDQDLLLKIFQEYGRTCRRYSQTVNEIVEINIPSTMVGHNQEQDIVIPSQTFFAEETVTINMPVTMIAHDQQTEIASV